MKGKLSARAAAERFGIGVATAIVWERRARESGSRAAKPRGQPRGSKLDAHREAILGWIAEKADLTISEIREKLRSEHGLTAAVGTVWEFLDCCGLTFNNVWPAPSARVFSNGAFGSRINVSGLRLSPGQDGIRAFRAS